MRSARRSARHTTHFAESDTSSVTPASIEQVLEEGFQRRRDVDLNLTAVAGPGVRTEGTVATSQAGSSGRS